MKSQNDYKYNAKSVSATSITLRYKVAPAPLGSIPTETSTARRRQEQHEKCSSGRCLQWVLTFTLHNWNTVLLILLLSGTITKLFLQCNNSRVSEGDNIYSVVYNFLDSDLSLSISVRGPLLIANILYEITCNIIYTIMKICNTE